MSHCHKEALAHLLFGIKVGGGFVALTGEVGTGKTTICRSLLDQLPENTDVALIVNPKLKGPELLATICDELQINYSHVNKSSETLVDFIDGYFPHENKNHKTLVDLINEYLLNNYSKGRQTVLIIDEAQNLSLDVLEQIRLLTNLETNENKLLQIILVGQPELQLLLNRDELRQLNQRITARYHLLPLSKKETSFYIRHRISISKGNPDLFSNAAIKKIHRLTHGVPRLINILCDRSLLGAYATNKKVVNSEIVKKAALEVLPPVKPQVQVSLRLAWLLTAFVIVLAGLYGLDYFEFTKSSLFTLKNDTPASVHPFKTTQNQQVINAASQNRPLEFGNMIKDDQFPLIKAFTQLFTLWGEKPVKGTPLNCQYLLRTGLRCLKSQTSWDQLKGMNRPVILSLSLFNNERRYVLLTGLNKDQAIIRLDDKNIRFPINEILPFWTGEFLFFWKPPFPDMKYIYPQQTSNNVLWLRHQLTIVDGKSEITSQPRWFDKRLKERIINFQRRQNLAPDGVVGPKTIIHLINASKKIDSPRLELEK